MKRNILSKLIEWKNKKNRKPLIVNGARQVGKTFILKEFGSCYYEKMAYVNCDKNKMLEKIFAQDYNISRILLSLSAILHMSIFVCIDINMRLWRPRRSLLSLPCLL